jgi:threonyl-tRNA synthetase
VLPISEGQIEWARAVYQRLRAAGVRVHLDQRNETLNYRIRDGELMKVPYLAVVGQREAEQGTVAVRVRGAKQKQEIMGLEGFVELVRSKIASRALDL